MKEDISNEPSIISLEAVDAALGDDIRALGAHLQKFLQAEDISREDVEKLTEWLKDGEQKVVDTNMDVENPLYKDLAFFLQSELFDILKSTKECLQHALETIHPELLSRAVRQRIVDTCTEKEFLNSHLHELLTLETQRVPFAAVEAWVDSLHAGKHILPPLESQGLFVAQDLVALEMLTGSFIEHVRQFVFNNVRLEQPDAEKSMKGDTFLLGLTFHTHNFGEDPVENFMETSANLMQPYLSHSLIAASLIGVKLKYDFPQGKVRINLEIPLLRA